MIASTSHPKRYETTRDDILYYKNLLENIFSENLIDEIQLNLNLNSRNKNLAEIQSLSFLN